MMVLEMIGKDGRQERSEAMRAIKIRTDFYHRPVVGAEITGLTTASLLTNAGSLYV
ncbi:hypothetical protein [Nibrella saemangeumensis]|uniref:hypothetical protein n=1 Tax=Nibrella saemangeumensis TaxID=1084526 RepID=UPI0031EFD421